MKSVRFWSRCAGEAFGIASYSAYGGWNDASPAAGRRAPPAGSSPTALSARLLQ